MTGGFYSGLSASERLRVWWSGNCEFCIWVSNRVADLCLWVVLRLNRSKDTDLSHRLRRIADEYHPRPLAGHYENEHFDGMCPACGQECGCRTYPSGVSS